MKEIDWKKDYQGEFVCPSCNSFSMKFLRKANRSSCKGLMFKCTQCNKCCKIPQPTNINPIADPTNEGVIWYTNHRIRGFICPNCQAKDIYFAEIDKDINKKRFKCRTCKKRYCESASLTASKVSRMSDKSPCITPFNLEADKWDLRTINPNFNQLDISYCNLNFKSIKPIWFKLKVKKYIYLKCKKEKSFSTLHSYLSSLRAFSRYLKKQNITNFRQINRSIVLDYLSHETVVNKAKLGGLKDFFLIGTIKGWFNIDQDIIRNEDYPKQHRGNPEPLSDLVREKIEQNLPKLPDPIARMWIICFFAAMRSSELSLLKQDCLVQEGQHWKLVWQRKKTDDYHEVPISRTIAKVVQEQLSYIQNLWGEDWDYLFCHYHGWSKTSLSKIKLKPVKKVVPSQNNPLLICIRTLIKELDIRDENNRLATFENKVLRPTRLTQLFEQGHDLAVVSAWAGHKHFATTSIYYTKVSCDLIKQEVGHIQHALVNSEGHRVPYESFPKSFWEKPQAHKLELSGTHINTPIYGYCGLDLDQDCHKFRACYTCGNFVATPEKLPQYIKTRDELRSKQSQALAAGQDVLVEQFGTQADQLDKIIASLQEAA
jgi:integrase